MKPADLPYDFDDWKKLPFSERSRNVCQVWATQGFGAPLAVYVFYILKIVFYIYIWFFFCSFSTCLGNFSNISIWWFKLDALYKAIFWTILIESIGLGGASGPLTARYIPPMGGMLYFLRPKTIKIPLFPNAPIVGGDSRNIFDIALYAAFLFFLIKVCISPEIRTENVIPVVILFPLLGLFDRTLFLSARGDVYFPMICCFLFPVDTISALKAVWFAVWFWAAVSKLTPSFTSVVCVMISNSPIFQNTWLRKKLFHNYPHDLRPCKSAVYISHLGTAIEFILPILLITSSNSSVILFALIGISIFHTFITLNVPMGVPIEWNIITIFGAVILFWNFQSVSITSLHNPYLIGLFALLLFTVPILGNLFPKYISFLLSMRYYAGTWAYSVWLFKPHAHDILEKKVIKTSPPILKQLLYFYDQKTAESILSRMLAFRMMHLPGRALHSLWHKAIDNLDNYVWMDGEFIAGEVVGWNFGDGHLHSDALLKSIQKRCNYATGELRCIFVESPSLHKQEMSWRIYDAKDGKLEQGVVNLRALKEQLP